MKVNQERILSIVEENEAVDDTTIVNTTYDRDGYRISHISMGKGTFMATERFRTPSIITVHKGVLKVVVKSKNFQKEVLVHTGQGFYKQANEFAGYHADNGDVIFTEYDLHNDSELSLRIVPHVVQDIIHLTHYEPGQVSRSHLINDEHFQLNMYAFSEPEKKEIKANNPLVITCLEGNVSIVHNDDKFTLSKGKQFLAPTDYDCSLFISGRTKLVVMHLSDNDQYFTDQYLF